MKRNSVLYMLKGEYCNLTTVQYSSVFPLETYNIRLMGIGKIRITCAKQVD